MNAVALVFDSNQQVVPQGACLRSGVFTGKVIRDMVMVYSFRSTSISTGAPGAWLESGAPVNWNVPGAAFPLAPAQSFAVDPRCGMQERNSESVEEDQVVGGLRRLAHV